MWTDNPEFVDYVDYSDELDRLDLPIGDFRVLVISATEADPGREKNQRHWLGLSPHARQVSIEGPHDLQEAAPGQVVTRDPQGAQRPLSSSDTTSGSSRVSPTV